jgi:hypothetical protein
MTAKVPFFMSFRLYPGAPEGMSESLDVQSVLRTRFYHTIVNLGLLMSIFAL